MDTYCNIIVLFTGFAQRNDELGNAIPRLADKLRKKWSSPSTLIVMLPWYTDPDSTAKFIALRCADNTKVMLVGYSFGGQTAANVSRYMVRYCTPTQLFVVLSDAVARSALVPRWFPTGWLASINPFARIRVSPLATRVVSFIQDQGWPKGHPLSPPREPQRKVQLPHTEMDGCSQFHQSVKKFATLMHEVK